MSAPFYRICRDCLAYGTGLSSPCALCGSARVFSHAELDGLCVAHVDCDAFYASVEKRDDPSLAEAPLLIGHDGGRGVVTTACYVARRYGCRSAMPMFKALALCPNAVVKRPDMAKYKAVSAEIRRLFANVTGLFEAVSIDEAFLDLSPLNRVRDEPPAMLLSWLSLEVERRAGVTISTGLSCNKFLAKLASDLDKPRGFAAIGPREARTFLAPLPVTKIHGVGAATAAKMHDAGWTTIGQLQDLSERELAGRFGAFGHRLAEVVHGRDGRQIKSARPVKSISAETTFSVNKRSFEDLREALPPLCLRVCASLKAKDIACRTVTLKLKTADFQIATRRKALSAPTQRYDVIFETAARLLRDNCHGTPFRLIGVGVSDFSPGTSADPLSLLDLC